MKLNRVTVILTASLLPACATSAPLPAPSALFQGQASIKSVEGGTSAKPSGRYNKDDVFAEREVIYSRMGRLTEDAVYKGATLLVPWERTIPAGTEVYAFPYRTTYGYNSLSSGRSQLGWCAPGKNKSWFAGADSNIPICMFWFDGKQAKYIEGLGNQSAYYAPRLNANMTLYGSIPQVKEDEVDIGHKLFMRLKFREVDKKDFDIRMTFYDGEKEVFMRSFEAKKKEDGTATLNVWGGEFKISEVDPDNENVAYIEVIKEPTGAVMDITALQDILLKAIEAAKAKREAEEAENADAASKI